MTASEDLRVITSGNCCEILQYLSDSMTEDAKEEVVGLFKKRVLPDSEGNEGKGLQWLKNLFLEEPLQKARFTADNVITIYSFFLNRLYPSIKSWFRQHDLISLLNDLQITLEHWTESLVQTPQQHNQLLRLQAIVHRRVGSELSLTMQHDLAMKHLQMADAIMEHLVAVEPANSRFLKTLSNVHQALGHLEKNCSATAAKVWFRKSLEIRQRLLDHSPDDPDCLDQLGRAYVTVGDMEDHSANGETAGHCLCCYLKAYKLFRQALMLKPEDKDIQFSLAMVCERIGQKRLDQQKPQISLMWVIRAYKIKERQFMADNTRPPAIENFWVACNLRGLAAGDIGKHFDARCWLVEALDLAERLYSLDRDNLRYGAILAMACFRLAKELEEVTPHEAENLYEKSREMMEYRIRQGAVWIDHYNLAIAAMEGLERLAPNPPAVKWKSRCAELRKIVEQLH